MAELVVEHLKIRLGGIEILKDVSLELNRGEITACSARPGSGKTTLLRSVAGSNSPTMGASWLGASRSSTAARN